MSRSWASRLPWVDRLLVSLEPEAVAYARLQGYWRPRLVDKRTVASEQPLNALRIVLAALGKTRLDVSVVLSNRLVRYAVVPFDAAVSSPEEELALARFYFARVHGPRAGDWELRLSAAGPGQARLASAVDAALMRGLRACFPEGGRLRLVSVQPYLMAAWNRWRGEFSKRDAWIVLPEGTGACAAYASHAGWQAARMLRPDDTPGATVADALARERLRIPSAPGAALVHGPEQAAPADWKRARLTLPALDGYLPLEDGAYAMALCAQ